MTDKIASTIFAGIFLMCVILVMMIVYLIIPVFGFIVTQFNTTETAKNITFITDRYTYIYVNLPKFANVTNATINITGYNGTSWIFTDKADTYYNVTGSWTNVNNINDSNWGTYGYSSSVGYYYVNYSKPAGVTEAKAFVIPAAQMSGVNVSIPADCFTDPIEMAYESIRTDDWKWIYMFCYNGTEWRSDFSGITEWGNEANGHGIYEEGMYFGFYNQTLTNISIDTGSDGFVDYYYNDSLNYTVSPRQVILNYTAINQSLSSCTPDVNWNCSVPINITTVLPGILLIDTLNVTFDWYGYLNITTQENDQNLSLTILRSKSNLFNLTAYEYGGDVNTTLNVTWTGDLTNKSIVAFVEVNNVTLLPNNITNIEVNLTANDTIGNGNYSGYMKFKRMSDNNETTITINLTIENQTGVPKIMNSTFTMLMDTSQSLTYGIKVNNTGNYNLSMCNLSITSSVNISQIWTAYNFNITNGTGIYTTVQITPNAAGIDLTSFVTVLCSISSPNNQTSQDSLRITTWITQYYPPTTGGGGLVIINNNTQIGINFTIGDGKCDTEDGEAVWNSPQDCRIDISGSTVAMVSIIIVIGGIAYLAAKPNKKSYYSKRY